MIRVQPSYNHSSCQCRFIWELLRRQPPHTPPHMSHAYKYTHEEHINVFYQSQPRNNFPGDFFQFGQSSFFHQRERFDVSHCSRTFIKHNPLRLPQLISNVLPHITHTYCCAICSRRNHYITIIIITLNIIVWNINVLENETNRQNVKKSRRLFSH